MTELSLCTLQVADVSNQLMGRFADCLAASLGPSEEVAREAVAEAARPVGGFGLALRALWARVKRWFRRKPR